MSPLALGIGLCAAHPCDRCPRCIAGGCCGESVRDDTLPAVGSWLGEVHGEVGALAFTPDGLVRCHVCGRAMRALGAHIGPAHGITADEYRAYFGLCAGTGLTGESSHQLHVAAGRDLTDSTGLADWNASATGEQRALVTWQRERRPERHRRAYSSDSQRRKALIRADGLRAEPERRDAMALLVRRAKRGDDPGRECPECGALFCSWTSRAGLGMNQSVTCLDQSCVRAARARAARTR